MTLISKITLDAIALDGLEVICGVPLDVYEKTIGIPSRSIAPGPLPPYGHRNNVIHFYDDLGLLLREHHATRLIEGIDFLLAPTRSMFPTVNSFSGELSVFGVNVSLGMDFNNFSRQCNVYFQSHLGHAWYIDGERISVQVEVYSETEDSNTVAKLISEVAIGFRGAHVA